VKKSGSISGAYGAASTRHGGMCRQRHHQHISMAAATRNWRTMAAKKSGTAGAK